MNTPNDDTQGASRSLWNLFSSGSDLSWPAEIGSLALRLFFGFAICWAAGISKFPLDAWFGDQVAGMGFPMPTVFAWAAALSEVAGGALLCLGLCTRFASFFLAFTLGVAAFGFHKIPFTSAFTTQHITLMYFWVFTYFTLAGSGRLSLDGLLRSRGAIAAGVAVVLTTAIGIACAMRTAPPPAEPADAADITSLVLAGSFNDWALDANPLDETEPGVWSGTVEVTEPTAIEFKFVGNADWDLAVGENDQPGERFPVAGTGELTANAGNIEAYLPAAGEYRFEVQLDGLTYKVERVDEPRP